MYVQVANIQHCFLDPGFFVVIGPVLEYSTVKEARDILKDMGYKRSKGFKSEVWFRRVPPGFSMRLVGQYLNYRFSQTNRIFKIL